jgi:hypothetical protein
MVLSEKQKKMIKEPVWEDTTTGAITAAHWMCAPGLKVSVDNPDERMVPSKLKGLPTMAPKALTDKEATKQVSNPLAIPLKVPGIG